MATNKTRWTHEDMIAATLEWWGDDDLKARDCKVVESDYDDEPCLIVIHTPSGRTSREAHSGGCWHLDGTAFDD